MMIMMSTTLYLSSIRSLLDQWAEGMHFQRVISRWGDSEMRDLGAAVEEETLSKISSDLDKILRGGNLELKKVVH